MTFHIRFSDARELRDALTPHNGFASKQSPGLDALVKFTAIDNKLTLLSFSYKASYIDNFTGDIEYCLIDGEGEAVMSIEKLYKIAQKLPQDREVEMYTKIDENLDLEDDNTIIGDVFIKCGRAKFRLPLHDNEFYQPIHFDKDGVVATINVMSNKLLECFKKVGRFAPTNANFATFNSVYLNLIDDVLHAVATDGKKIVVYDLNARVQTNDPENVKVIIPTESFKKVESSLNNLQYEGEVVIQVTDKRVRFIAGEYCFTLNLINGTYPDWASLVPTELNNHFHISIANTKNIIERSVIFDEVEGVQPVRLKKTDEGLLVEGKESPTGSHEDVMEVDMSNCRDFSNHYNSRFILDALSIQNGMDCRIDILENNAVFIKSITKEGAKMQCMVMPLRWN